MAVPDGTLDTSLLPIVPTGEETGVASSVSSSEEQPMKFDPETQPTGTNRLGNNTEGATLITAGPFSGHVAVLDGYDVLAVSVESKTAGVPKKLFSVASLKPIANPSGIAYARSERNFFFSLQHQWNTLWITDESGNPLKPRPITYLPGFDPALIISAEGMTYMPPGSSFPDRLVRVLFVGPQQDAHVQLEILTLEGFVEHEIRPGPPLGGADTYILGITQLHSSDGFLISRDDGSFWTVGADGSVLSGPVTASDLPMAEALTRLNDGRVVAASYSAGKLLAFDSKMARENNRDRTVAVGPGLSHPFFGAWDAVTGYYVLLGIGRDSTHILATVPPSLNAADTLFRVPAPYTSVAGLQDEHAFALGRAFPPFGIDIVGRDGAARDQIQLANVVGLPNQRVVGLAYIPTTRQFAIWLRREPNKIWIVSRSGILDSMLSVPPTFGMLQCISEEGEDRLQVWAPPTLYSFDLAGNVIALATPSVEGLVNPWGYVAGPNGQFLLIDAISSEAVLRSM